MTLLDYIIFGILFFFVWLGFWSGFIRTLGSIIGIFLGVAIASHFYSKISEWFKFFALVGVSQFFAFILIVVVVSKLTSIVFWIIDKMFKVIAIIPFLKTFNRLLGAGLGFIEGILIIGVALLFASKITIFPAFTDVIQASKVAEPLLLVANIFLPLFPAALKQTQELLP